MQKNTMIATALLLGAFTADAQAITPQEFLADEKNEIVFADGVVIRKGSVGATILNYRAFHALKEAADPTFELEKLRQDQLGILPGVHHAGLFELFLLQIER